MKRKATEGGRKSRSSGVSEPAPRFKEFVICVANPGYPVSLEVRKVYERLTALPGDPKSWLRVLDESGEDYLYPREFFHPLALPKLVEKAFAATQG